MTHMLGQVPYVRYGRTKGCEGYIEVWPLQYMATCQHGRSTLLCVIYCYIVTDC